MNADYSFSSGRLPKRGLNLCQVSRLGEERVVGGLKEGEVGAGAEGVGGAGTGGVGAGGGAEIGGGWRLWSLSSVRRWHVHWVKLCGGRRGG